MPITYIVAITLILGAHASSPGESGNDHDNIGDGNDINDVNDGDNGDDVEIADYDHAIAAVEQGLVQINTDPSSGIPALRAALTELHAYAPILAEDPARLELRTLAELALARALLSVGDDDEAAATVDAVLEGLAGAPLPADQLGPSLAALVEQRQEVLRERGHARLRVICAAPCRIFVDERSQAAATAEGVELALGEHRLWIHSDTDAPVRTTLSLAERDATLTLTYPQAIAVEPPAPGPSRPRSTHESRRSPMTNTSVARTAPRWVEVTTLVVGTAALAAGGLLWAIDSRCPRGADRADPGACPELFDTRTAGIALVAAGAAATLTGGVMLSVDEARVGDRRGMELALVWTRRF